MTGLLTHLLATDCSGIPETSMPSIAVLDTNIVLDLFVFEDPRTAPLREALSAELLHWHATQHMRNELERVLTYPQITAKLAFYEKTVADILSAFDQAARIIEASPPKAIYTCKDPDDQPFIDLACYLASLHPDAPAQLISKDKAVLSMRKRLQTLSVFVSSSLVLTRMG
jgi:putative PIN family toxin of toxin-antitoxin system